ncbi:MAG: putative peptidoglycan glycosyltransferase FtsW [Candidatus Taylorbacteria bacterium]|nr:putative peptidoglycan glycosyltransferase FtsW [Candidatus Taylorbacteria bacterium]
MNGADKPFLYTVILLVAGGFLMFYSASLSLFAKDTSTNSTLIMQGLGLLFGFMGMFAANKVPYTFWKKFSFFILVGAVVINLIILVPGIGMEHGGAIRWIQIKNFTFQPSELLKIAYIIYLAAWISKARDKIENLKEGVIPFLVISSMVAILMYIQKDTDTMAVILGTGVVMVFCAGMKWRHLLLLLGIGALFLGGILITRPYALQRVTTFINPTKDSQGAAYQIQQSLIAIGSGGAFGKGLGQSVQKFNYLPEPTGDSIFAVAGEEFGFLGAILLVLTYLFLVIRGFKIATKAPDSFGRLIVVGIVILVAVESYMNMSAMLGIIPLSGMPLLFVSHGGTALAIAIAEMGIVLNVSKAKQRRTKI